MKLHSVVYVLMLSVVAGWCRTPENLAGTDLFPDEIVVNAELKTGESSTQQVAVALPTKVLNLAYGAELFTCGLQNLYHCGEIVKLQKKTSAADAAVAHAADARKRYKQVFYKNISPEEILAYDQSNPLMPLIRMLFWQIPETVGLADFRISNLCELETMEATVDAWAQLVAYTISLYKPIAFGQTYQGSEHKKEHIPDLAIEPFKNAWGIFKKKNKSKHSDRDNVLLNGLEEISMSRLLVDCIGWSEKNAFGRDFPLRVLMAGVYALVGSEQKYIFRFYQKLSSELSEKKILPAEVIPELPVGEVLQPQFIQADMNVAMPARAEALLAYRALKRLRGVFEPLPYSYATVGPVIDLPDCFESVLRNIVLALIIKPDGTFKEIRARSDLNTFLSDYPSMAAQATSAARNRWALLVSNVHGASYVKNSNCELRAMFVNMLITLNYLFDLDITMLSEHVADIHDDKDLNRAEWMSTALSAVNQKIKEKLGRDDVSPIITITEPYNQAKSNQIQCKIQCEDFSLIADIDVNVHASIAEVQRNLEAEQSDCGPFLLLKCLQHRVPSAAFGWHNVALLQPSMSMEQAEALTQCNHIMKRMLFVFAVRYYQDDKNIFFNYMDMLVRNGCCIQEAKDFAIAGAHSTHLLDQFRALQLFKKLVDRGSACDEASDAAAIGILSTNKTVYDAALKLFKDLFALGLGFNDAADAACEGMLSPSSLVRSRAIKLFKELFAKGHAFEAAKKVAYEAMFSTDTQIRNEGINLYKELVLKNYALPEAVDAAKKAVTCSDDMICFSALKLFKALVDKRYELGVAEKAACENIWSDNASIRGAALNLFKKLFNQGDAFEAAEGFIAEATDSADDEIRECAHGLKKILDAARAPAVSEEAAVE
jgi:hypothetical protein